MSLASGSSGNCYFLGTEDYGILIDAGVPARVVRKCLGEAGVEVGALRAVFITHDHGDHIKGVAALGEHLHIPVYATEATHTGIGKNYCMKEKLTTSARIIRKEEPVEVGAFRVEAFEVPHDGTDNVGYCIEVMGRVFVFLTDLGYITDKAAAYCQRADYLIIEANYDEEMLRTGPYPAFLKERIAGPTGHLSNQATAEFLATQFPPDLKHIWLCHLSRENNHPELAVKTVAFRLREAGIEPGWDVEITPLKRYKPSIMYKL